MKPHVSPTRQLAIFFCLAFAIGWIDFLPLMLSHTVSSPLAFIGLYAPAIAALCTLWLTNGQTAILILFQRLRQWRFALGWYILASGLLPTIYLIAVQLQSWFEHTPVQSLWLGTSWYFVAASYLFLLIVTAGEEIGWRGFALPLMQSLADQPLRNSIILGVIWGVWHAPLYLLPGPGSCPFPLFLLFTMALSILYSLLFVRTNGSLIPAILLHASSDVGPRFLDFAHFTNLTWILIVGLCSITAVMSVAQFKRMNRSDLQST